MKEIDPITGEEPVMIHKPEISKRTQRLALKVEERIKSDEFKNDNHKALDALIKLAAYKLKRVGKKEEANKLLKEWEETYSREYLFRLFGPNERHIGDYPPVSQWLESKMNVLTFILGMQVMYSLRLSDIVTFNSTPKTVFFCKVPVSEQEFFFTLGIRRRRIGERTCSNNRVLDNIFRLHWGHLGDWLCTLWSNCEWDRVYC